MATIDRIPLNRAVAVVRDGSISVRPSRAQILRPIVLAAIAGTAVWLMVTYISSLPLWVLTVLLVVALLLGPAAVLGIVYSVYGNEFLAERAKQSARWQQGFLGLGIGTFELVPFWRIERIEVGSDIDEDLSSGQQQDVVQFDVRIVKDNGRVLDVGSIVVPRVLAEDGLARANRLGSHLAALTEREFTPLALAEHAPAEAAAEPVPIRRRRRSRRRAVRPPERA